MSLDVPGQEFFKGFSKLDRSERLAKLVAMGALTAEDLAFLDAGGVQTTTLAEKLIENSLGYFQLPLGIAVNFVIDGRTCVIPMAVEETSIIAALSKTAKWIAQSGQIDTWVEGECIVGQIQFAKVNHYQTLYDAVMQNKDFLIEKANEEVAASMVKRGGGVRDLQLRRLQREEGGDMAVIHLLMNSCDAMGANIINQILEYLKPTLENLSNEKVSMCILSNLNDQKLTHARVTLHAIEPELGQRIEEASRFAELDPYRASTHNKGVMNGIDPVLIATGNDWRAVEAGVHAYAARNGRYQAITSWRYHPETRQLTGYFCAPLIVGTVGGVTALHPTAKMCLRMLGISKADELSRVIAAVGLVQNLGAITALCTVGIIQGHMKLHIDNLLLSAGANAQEMRLLKPKLQAILTENKRVSLSDASLLLAEIRQRQVGV
ncbi:MAG: hydroxymethylglutaryl-CoA reductase, degradative [Legionellaceae bacterium]|nr:hydroxymethylglutaryl-CoA reductase, degradative [Legionellaceae bacterium]